MPVIAKSPPLIYGTVATPDVPPPPIIPPSTSPTPGAIIISPPGSCNMNRILSDHQIFVDRVNLIGACFRREAMPELTDQDFQLHIDLSLTDKFLVKNGDMFCSKQAVENLSKKLKRTNDV